MRIYIKVTPKSSRNKIEKVSTGEYKVWVTVAPEKNKANRAVIELLAKYFQVSKSQISIIAGKTTAKKLVEILQ